MFTFTFTHFHEISFHSTLCTNCATPKTKWPPPVFPLESSQSCVRGPHSELLHSWQESVLSKWNFPLLTFCFFVEERGRGFRVPARGDQWHEREASAAHQGSPCHQSQGGGHVLEQLQQGRLLHHRSGEGALGSGQLPTTLLMFNGPVPL